MQLTMRTNNNTLEGLARFEVLNQTEMNVIAGGLLAESTTNSDKKDVDSNSQDSYRDDKTNAIAIDPSF